jgi:3-dehydroquinate dehydratase
MRTERGSKSSVESVRTLSMIRVNLIGPCSFYLFCWRHDADAIIINPAGLSSRRSASSMPVMEVHISNIHARDDYHRHSKISFVATGVIAGLGPFGYIAAMNAIARMS